MTAFSLLIQREYPEEALSQLSQLEGRFLSKFPHGDPSKLSPADIVSLGFPVGLKNCLLAAASGSSGCRGFGFSGVVSDSGAKAEFEWNGLLTVPSRMDRKKMREDRKKKKKNKKKHGNERDDEDKNTEEREDGHKGSTAECAACAGDGGETRNWIEGLLKNEMKGRPLDEFVTKLNAERASRKEKDQFPFSGFVKLVQAPFEGLVNKKYKDGEHVLQVFIDDTCNNARYLKHVRTFLFEQGWTQREDLSFNYVKQ
mmetsp:Transcript_16714/g.42732  ORF Transcript_16714/g.42732 Transcript_16714/m.42732 type:complete len:256 (+) Transcript_16714:180-947(+)|eukprot:CAMPEP_0177647600 /NCGR_PEP_ID=MMETSP0447-20121125/10385_1 /TAXON_ID=0 /ORGANISM="Stygamoeba regulata, Strain BSH-02190019" /LENGTH=255 /DNA_ID=CAMNT_0019150193 /DNA_START=174 /DNA_END=941 /DNA_ORIENTATION=-